MRNNEYADHGLDLVPLVLPTRRFAKGLQTNNLVIWRLDWDAMLGTNGAVWLTTQAIRNDAVRPSPAGQMDKLFVYEP